MHTILAKAKKKSRTKKVAKKKAASRRKNAAKKKTNKNFIKGLNSRFKINKNNWIVFYYAAAYIGIFGFFALAIYYSNQDYLFKYFIEYVISFSNSMLKI